MSRKELIAAVVDRLSGYRRGEVAPIDAAHVDQWVRQFPDDTHEVILSELNHVWEKLYFPESWLAEFADTIVEKLPKEAKATDDAAWWRDRDILLIQQGGNSQRAAYRQMEAALTRRFGKAALAMGLSTKSGGYVYIDEAMFSGQRVKVDLCKWISDEAPLEAHVDVVCVAMHAYGEWRARKEIKAAIAKAGKRITLSWLRALTLENRVAERERSDVLWPTALPDEDSIKAFATELTTCQYPWQPRPPGTDSANDLFSSEAARHVLEQQFFLKGFQMRQRGTFAPVFKPLGYLGFPSPGFGTLCVTHRNCPNNAPLVLWADGDWYPLVPRKNN